MSAAPVLSTERCVAAIESHSRGFAEAARGNLDARVEHCPAWSVADLVWHLTEVHWFWGTIVDELLSEPPGDSRRPARPEDPAELVPLFEAGARRLVDVLGRADQAAPCWTWAVQRDVAFVTRHQVQEAAVHHWDAAHAAGHPADIEPDVSVDSVEEFLTFSVSSADDPADPPQPALAGAFWICACAGSGSAAPTWLVTDGPTPGTVAWQRLPDGTEPADVAGDVPLVGGHADPPQVLLWLYGRTADLFEGGPVGDAAVLDRFRALCFTD